ncbi:MAG TPA: response regulator [Flavisolibacter sp.]|nr:response regulator [Flavisolibacter sp.]
MKTESYFLYAEDDEDDVVLLKDMLKLSGSANEIVAVKDGFEAISYLQSVQKGGTYPSLIILDINMPRMNGRETLEFLKTDDIYCLIPVLMFSVNNTEEHINFCAQMGTEIVSKPTNFDAWFQAIKKITSYVEL